ncbi:hypothetical protein COLO4_19187 [Corchorus olitorius]|uniref:Non-haem dioxygenase N-terminal domain-containing protein n=1 Tax=Corchorus olitorius TaxID=93759 RepID=A0A1R3J6H3_9ROSI|nr:hypothetical protein COLO4_19187 [Corchorus olitorius]
MNIESSYPPLFGPHSNLTQNSDNVEPIEEDLEDSVPVIDLHCLNLNKFEEAGKNWGVFRLANHGVPSKLVTQIQDHAIKLFSLSFENKQAILSTPLSYVWGTVFLSSSGAAVRSSNGINRAEVISFPLSKISQFQTQDSLLHSFRYN